MVEVKLLFYYVADVESTGLSAGVHEINQISIIRCSDGKQYTTEIIVKNPYKADKRALEVQGRTIADLKNGIPREEAVKIVTDFILEDGLTPAHRCIVGHNVPFDRRFIQATWSSLQQKFPAELWLCTKEFTRKLAKRKALVKPKLNLQASMEIAGLPIKQGAHDAGVDAYNTFELFKHLMNENLNHLSVIKNVPHE